VQSVQKRSFTAQVACSAALLAVLAGCGGGGGDDGGSSDAPASVQQYPAGVYTGQAGPLSAQRDFIGYIDGGSNGTGGLYYFAKDSGGQGYDGLYGTLSVTGTALRAPNSTYFSTVDSKFATLPLLVTGTVTGAAADVKTNARIVGSYANPVGTSAATGAALVPFTLNYSAALTEHPSSLALLKGTYRSGGAFGSNAAVVSIDALGNVTGSNLGCTFTGTARTPNAQRGIYNVSLTLGGTAASCPRTGSTESGIAVIAYDAAGAKQALWVFTTAPATSTRNTFVINAVPDPEPLTPPPATTPQVATGLFTGTVASGATSDGFNGVVLPSNQYFFYRNRGSSYDVLYGSLSVAPASSVFSSTNGTYYASAAGTYTGGVVFTGDVRTRGALTGSFADPTAGNSVAQISATYSALFDARAADVATLAGKTYRQDAEFSGRSMQIAIDATGTITGSNSDNCTVGGTIAPYTTPSTANLYTVTLIYGGATCTGANRPREGGVAIAEADGGLRILTAGYSEATQARYTTVFLSKPGTTTPVTGPVTTPAATTTVTATP
jgi:hypothetical protein